MADGLQARAAWAGQKSFPGMDKLPLPATPGDKDSRQMLVAHRIDDTVRAIGHGEERMSVALKSATPELRKYHSTHIANHLAVALSNMHYLVDDIKRHYPDEAAELEAVRQCVGLAKSLDRATRIATTAHLCETVLHELTHGKRHADQMLKTEPKLVWEFNADHARKHLKGAQEHIDKLSEHVMDNYPAEGRWLKILKQLQDGYVDTTPPAQKALKLAAGSVPPSTFNITIPRKNDQYGLRQKPSQTVSPSPPLPARVPLPSAKDCRALIKQVPDGIDVTLSNTVRNALEQAAVKFEKNDVILALQCLRQAQSALYAASKKDAGAGRPAVYGPAAVPAAAHSSALAQMLQAYQEQHAKWRKLGTAVAQLIDRTRRHWFAGRVNGYLPTLRM